MLSSGEEVNLYCHSLELGPYRDLKRPPTHASPAVFGLINSDTSIWENRLDSLYFPVSECATYAVKELAAGYDSGKMTLGDQEAFERMGFFSSDRLTPEPRLPESLVPVSTDPLPLIFPRALRSLSTELVDRCRPTFVDGKTYVVDYQNLQEVAALRRANLDWKVYRDTLQLWAGHPNKFDESPTRFRIVFETGDLSVLQRQAISVGRD